VEEKRGMIMHSDRHSLQTALRKHHGWNTIYFAKRLLQTDPNDQEALEALATLPRISLTCTDPLTQGREINSLLAGLDYATLTEIVRAGELIEREKDTVLFEYDDEGDTMFIILKGELGVYMPDLGAPSGQAVTKPADKLQAGDIAGELAFALKRCRTATLKAVRPTSLLSLSSFHVRRLQERSDIGQAFTAQLERVVIPRILQHICNSVDYLVGRDNSGPLASIKFPWVRVAAR
jgi:hypothetical protein